MGLPSPVHQGLFIEGHFPQNPPIWQGPVVRNIIHSGSGHTFDRTTPF